VEPDDPNAPAASAMNKVTLTASNSTFTYDGRPVNDIGIDLKARINETRAEVQDLMLRSPVAEAHLQGTMDDWRALRYQLNVTSSVDLTQLSDLLQPGAALRGAGTFAGNISGEGERYNLKGTIKSDALAADRVRLQGLSVTANGSGDGKSYKVNGNAVAQLLTAGDFQLNSVQLAGNGMGTGSDFRWIGELRALAAKGYGTTIAGLILHDARAELENGVLTASARQLTAGGITSGGAKVHNLSASTLRVRNDKGATAGSVAEMKVGQVDAAQGQLKSIGVNGIDFTDKNGVTSVSIKDVLVGGFVSEQAEVGTFNIAGVRLSIRSGKIEGSTNDITPG